MGKFSSLGLNVATGVRMEITLPGALSPLKDEQGRVAYLELLSPGSPQALKFQQERLRRGFEKQRLPVAKRLDEAAAKFIENQIDEIVVHLTGWYILHPDGTVFTVTGPDGSQVPVPCNEDNARELLAEPGVYWLRDAATGFIQDASNFTKASPES